MNLSHLLSFLSPVYPFTFVLTSNLGPSFTVDPLFKQNKKQPESYMADDEKQELILFNGSSFTY